MEPLYEHLRTTFSSNIHQMSSVSWFGRVQSILGLMMEIVGVTERVSLGSLVAVSRASGKPILGEVVGFRDHVALVMGYEFLEGIKPRAKVEVLEKGPYVYPVSAWRGRVVDGLARPIDGKGPLPQGPKGCFLKANLR